MALYWSFLIAVGVLMIASIVRWQSTPQTDPEHLPRQETVYLLVALFCGAAVLLVQTRFPLNSTLFYACFVVLVPIVFIVLLLLRRLYRAYRQFPIEPSSHDRS